MSTFEIEKPEDFLECSTVRTGETHTFRLHRYDVRWLEFEASLFHHDSAVMMPDGSSSTDQLQGLEVVHAAYRHAYEHPQHKLLIAGHTDSSGSDTYNEELSYMRAENVLAVVLGDEDSWATIAGKKSNVEDYQRILTWIAGRYGWTCDPKGIDDVHGRDTTHAVESFQEAFSSASFGTRISVDGSVGPQTWRAFFQMYTEALKELSNTDRAGLEELRGHLVWLYDDRKCVGCGEYHPVDEAGLNDRRSSINRRIELLFYAPGQEPRTKPGQVCHEGGAAGAAECPIYNVLYEHTEIPVVPVPAERGSLYDQISWRAEAPGPSSHQGIKIIYSDAYADEQVGFAYREDVSIVLELRQSLMKRVATGSSIRVEFEREGEPANVAVRELRVDRQEGASVYVEFTHADAAEVLDAVGFTRADLAKEPDERTGGLHYTWLRAYIPEGLSVSGTRVKATNLAYPTLQTPLYFLPGVLGSELSVVNHNGEVEECFPETSIIGDGDMADEWGDWLGTELELLVFKSDGTPHREVLQDRLRILDNVYHFETVYACDEVVADLLRDAPAIFSDATKTKRLLPVAYRDVPYDWRLNISKSHYTIAEEILEHFRGLEANVADHPFLHDKISIAGHSTGGVVMRGFASTDNVLNRLDLVENYFHINVPHLGAPKAEYVFLTGDMGVPFVTKNSSFRQMAPDMPIVYFLTANSRYGELASQGAPRQDWSVEARKRRVDRAVRAGAYDTKKEKLYGYPQYETEGPLTFNMQLAEAAEEHFDRAARHGPAVKAHSYVFHSGGHPTISSTSIVGKEIVANKTLIGDGTVPTISQIADIGSWANSTLFKSTEGQPEHVPAPNSKWVWKRIMDVLAHRPVDEHTIPFPKDMREMAALVLRIALDTYASHPGVAQVEHEKTLEAGSTETYVHNDVDYGIALVQCDAGTIRIEASRAVWSKYQSLSTVTLSEGAFSLVEIPKGHSRFDQDNQIVITGIAKSSYRIEYLSIGL